MATNDYYSILTTVGTEKLAQAIITEIPVRITTIAVGDGNGQHYFPTPDQTQLKRETWRGDINDLRGAEDAANYVLAEGVIPIEVGGWTVREVGLFDSFDNLIAIANYPDTIKPLSKSGSGKQLYIQVVIHIDNVAALELIINHDVVIASKKFVSSEINKLKDLIYEPGGGNDLSVTPTGLTAPRFLKDYFADRVDLRNIAGFVGDGRDESGLFEWAAQKANMLNVPLIIPERSIVGLGSAVALPVGTNIRINGQLRSLAPDVFSFIDPLFFESTIISQSLVGDTFVIVADASGFKVDDIVALKYKYPTDDDFYNSIAQDPTQMGYQRQILRVKRIEAGNKVVFGERLLWSVPADSTLSTVTERSTHIELSNSGKIIVAHNGYILDQQVSRLSIVGGEIDFSNISKGIRFRGAHFNSFRNVKFLNSIGGNTLFFAYGCCNNKISNSMFIGQQDGDAQLCFYAGGYGNSSSFNQFINGDNTKNRGSIMFGAKTWNNMSIGDVIHGGFYGASSFFGAQRNVFRDTMLFSQTYAGFFIEDSQFTQLSNPQVTFPYSNTEETTKGGIVFKACDGNVIEGGRVETKGSPTVSLYDDAGVQVQRQGLTIRGLKTLGGDIKVFHAIKDMQVSGLKMKNGNFIHYYLYGTNSNGYIDISVDNGYVMLTSFSYSLIKVRVDANSAHEYGLVLRGFGVYSTVRDSYVSNATVAAYHMSTPYPQTSTALDPHNNIAVNCPKFIDGGITQSITPVCPTLPPPGFYLPVNSFDTTQARTRMGYRARGTADTTYKQWAVIAAAETTQ